MLIVGVGAYKSRPSGADTAAIAAYRRIGAVTHHTTHAIIVDERLRAPAMYRGWIAGHYWYPPTPGQDLPAAGDPFPPWIEPGAGVVSRHRRHVGAAVGAAAARVRA